MQRVPGASVHRWRLRATAVAASAARVRQARWAFKKATLSPQDSERNPNDPRNAATFRSSKSAIPDSVLGANTGSQTSDHRAPKDSTPAERKEWLKKVQEGYVAPRKTDSQATWEGREGKIIPMFGDRDLPSREDQAEGAYLAKRRKQLEKMGDKVLVGAGTLISLWAVYLLYKSLTRRKDEHPAQGVYIGEAVELKLAMDGKTFVEPVVIGLFTQRAPFASENFHRLVTGDNPQGVSLTDTDFFQVNAGESLYGGTLKGQGARGGVVAVPGHTHRLPAEDSELPPFKYALVSCARSFFANGGFTSTFGILTTDNPSKIGAKQCDDYERVVNMRARFSLASMFTGVKRNIQRMELYPPEDGAYVFGVVMEGQKVIDRIMSQVRAKPPHYKPDKELTVTSCRVIGTNLPGRKEMPVTPETPEVKDLIREKLERAKRESNASAGAAPTDSVGGSTVPPLPLKVPYRLPDEIEED